MPSIYTEGESAREKEVELKVFNKNNSWKVPLLGNMVSAEMDNLISDIHLETSVMVD